MNGWQVWIIPLIGVAVWIIGHLLSNKEQEQRKNQARRQPGDRENPQAGQQPPLTDLDRFLRHPAGMALGVDVLRLERPLQGADRVDELGLDPVEFLCRGGVCPALEDNGEPRYRDMDHLRATFVREHAEFIDRTLKKDE